LVTGAAGWNTFFATVPPEADALETGVAVVVETAEAVIAARNIDPDGTDLAHRGRARRAAGVDAWVAGNTELAGALFGPIAIDVRAEIPQPRAVLILVAGLKGANTEVRRRGHPADVALRAVEIAVTGHATIGTRSRPSSLTGKAEGTVVALGDAITARGDPDAALTAGSDSHALVIARVGTFGNARARASPRRLTLFDRSTLESIATRVDADIPDEAVGGGVANEEFVGARVAKRIRRARTERATRAATRG
jgi:hypothetical protein